MKKRLPEQKIEQEIVPLEIQIEMIQRISLNRHFTSLRGMLEGNTDMVGKLESMKYVCEGVLKAPSRYVKDLKVFCESLPVVFGKLAQLERDGYMVAYSEIVLALKHREYLMLSEHVPYGKMIPVTLVVFYPKKAFKFFKATFLDHMEGNGDIRLEDNPFAIERLPGTTCESKECARWLWNDTESLIQKLKKYGPQKYSRYNNHTFFYARTLPNDSCLELKRAVPEKGLAFAFECEQKDLLRAFKRSEQVNVATWQFHLPENLYKPRYYGGRALNFGLHLEEEHGTWKQICGEFCSTGISNSHGAIAWPSMAYRIFFEEPRYKGTRILLSN